MTFDFKKISNTFFSKYLLLLIIVGLYSKLGDKTNIELPVEKISSYFKLALLIYLITYIVKYKLWRHVNILYVVVFGVISFLGQIILADGDLKIVYENIYDNGFTFAAFTFLPLFIIVINHLEVQTIVESNINMLKLLALINIPIVIVAAIFEIHLFKSYFHRFGFEGIFPCQASASYFYILTILIYYVEYIVKKERGIYIFLHSIFALLIGTKVIWLFLAILLFIHAFFLSKGRRAFFLRVFIFVSAAIVVYMFPNIKKLIIGFFPHGPSLNDDRGFISVLMSERDLYLEKANLFINEYWSWANYFFGGTNVVVTRVEMEMVNMFLFSGLFGVIVYGCFLKRNFFVANQQNIKTLLFFVVLFLSFFTGGVFYSVFVSTLFYITFKKLDFINEANYTRP